MLKIKSAKRLVSAFCAMAVFAMSMPVISMEAEAALSLDGMWEVLENDIVAYNGTESTVTIPSEITYISASDIDGNGVLDDEVTAEIKNVRAGVFTENTSLKTLIVSEGIQTLGTVAVGNSQQIFKGCVNLSDITLPSTLEEISSNLLEDCSVKNISVKSDIRRGSFGTNSGIESVTFEEGVTTVNDSFFSSSKTLKNIIFSDTVETIGEYAFAGCSELTEVNVPVTVKNINYRAFGDNPKLEKVTVGAENIGANAFFWNGKGGALTSLTLLDGVKVIGESAFAYQPLSSTLTLPRYGRKA